MKISIFLLIINLIFAVQVTLKDGSIYTGDLISQNIDELIIKTEFGELSFPVDQIDKINFSSNKLSNEVDKNNFKSNNSYSEFLIPNRLDLSKEENKNKRKIVTGLNASGVYGADADLEFEIKTGYRIGVQNISSKRLIGLSFESKVFELSQDGSNFNLESKYKHNFLSIDNALLIGNSYEGYLFLGGRFSYLFSVKNEFKVCFNNSISNPSLIDCNIDKLNKDDMDYQYDFDAGIIIGIDLPVYSKTSLNLIGYFGILKFYDENIKLFNRSIEVSLNTMF